MMATGDDDNTGGEGHNNDDNNCGSTSADNKQHQPKKGLGLRLQGGGAPEGEGTNPMQK